MPAAEKTGQMGYWRNESDPVALTLMRDQQALAKLQSEQPTRFTQRASKDILPRMQELLDKTVDEAMWDGGMSLLFIFTVIFGLTPKQIKWLAQLIGSCVASGCFRTITLRSLFEIVVLGDPEETLGLNFAGMNNLAPYGPWLYGTGRRRGNMKGGDGSYCSVQIEAAMKDGILRCDAPGLSDIGGTSDSDYPETQNQRLYRQWGDWKYLDRFKDEAAKLKLVESVQVTSSEQTKDLITNHFKPMNNCSGWGFAPQSKHKDGFWIYKRSGSWPHNLSITGYRLASDGNWFAEVLNSWGPEAHKDGPLYYIPQELDERWVRDSQRMSVGELDYQDSPAPEA